MLFVIRIVWCGILHFFIDNVDFKYVLSCMKKLWKLNALSYLSCMRVTMIDILFKTIMLVMQIEDR
jgi:hypothetical protein